MTASPTRSLGAELAAPPPQTGDHFPVLDTLRAVGALAVLTTHTSFESGAYVGHGVWGTMLARLDVGVAIFFVLSGFLLSRPYLRSGLSGHRRPGTGRYLWKRALRIMPVYVVAVVVALSLIDANAGMGVRDWVVTLLMLNTFVDPGLPHGLTHMWSLAVEVTFYLLLPLLMALAVGRRLRPGRLGGTLLMLCLVSVWWHLAGADLVAIEDRGSPMQWLPAYLIWFCLGIALAWVQLDQERCREQGQTPGRLTAIATRIGAMPGVCWSLAFALFLVAATPLAGPSLLAGLTPAQSLTKNLLYAGIGLFIVASGVFASGRYARVLGHTALRRMGWISYSVFCLHMCVLRLVWWATGWPLFGGHGLEAWLLTLALSLVVSEVVYRVVERPALRLKGVSLNGRRGTEAKTEKSGSSIR